MAVTLKKEVVVDEWWMLVEGAADKVEQVFKDTEDNIKKSKAPDVTFERVSIQSLLNPHGNSWTWEKMNFGIT